MSSRKSKALSPADQKARQFMHDYLNNASPTGYESKGQEMWVGYMTQFMKKGDEILTDSYGSVAAVIRGTNDNYKVVIEAHADEIAWAVTDIDDKGFLSVARNGGSDPHIAQSMDVIVHAKDGVVEGFFGAPAIHVRDHSNDKATKLEELFVDVGAKDKKAALKMGIDVGTQITFASGFKEHGPDQYKGRALDDRMCGFINTEIVRELNESKIVLPYTLVVVNAVQEEIGLRGAQMMANQIQADVAFCFDVGHDTQTRGYNKAKQGDFACGKGPIVSYGAPLQNKARELLLTTAAENKIPIQRRTIADGRSSGTDADSFAYTGNGTPTAAAALPLKYMHTTVETVHKKDMENMQKLIVASLQNITGRKDQFAIYSDKTRRDWQRKIDAA